MEDAVGIEIQQESNASTEKENENTENQKKANTSNENKSQNERTLVDVLKVVIETPVPPLSTECLIKSIPDHLSRVKEQAYTPTIISIGPIHHFDPKLQIMEMCKVRYFKRFISRNEINLENLVSTIREMEERIQSCYAETTFPFKHKDDFVKMVLVDAIFILELFHRYGNKYWERHDQIFLDKLMFMKYDLVLLENQLPFFVLEKLFNLTSPNCSKSISLIDLTFEFFGDLKFQKSSLQSVKTSPQDVKITDFTDLMIRTFQLPQLKCPPESQTSTQKVELLHSAAQLHEAGVKFKVSSSNCLHDIKFEITKGELEIPPLELYDETETLIRNVMALEQFRYPTNRYVTDYFIFLDDLINTTKDMDLLCNKKIVINHLGDNDAATSFLNNLNTNISMPDDYSNYYHICQKLNTFCEKRWHRWKATLRHQYFSTPWRTASTIAAIILLVFTFIQTVCSIIQIVPIV